MSIFQCKNLSKQVNKFTGLNFSKKTILNIDSLNIESGSIVGVLGENGSGKSTLLKILAGMSEFNGNLEYQNLPIKAFNKQLQQNQASILDINSLPKQMHVKNLLALYEQLYVNFDTTVAKQELLVQNIQLDDFINDLSKGNQAKVYLILTINTRQPLIILDEPTLGLDLNSRKYFYQTLLDLCIKNETTIIISSHEIDEIEFLLTNVILLNNGEIVLNDNMENLQENYIKMNVPLSQINQYQQCIRLNEQTSLSGKSFLLHVDDFHKIHNDDHNMFKNNSKASLSDIYIAHTTLESSICKSMENAS